jgi:ABC-type Zn uptake system ZnuABC Zn-binding protein ZnuA
MSYYEWSTHDLEDLLDLIKQLELRIIQLENEVTKKRLVMNDDSWYWDH